MPSELELAYIAGIVDGEGCISVAARLKKYVTPTVQVGNSNQELIEYLYSLFGGNIDIQRDNRNNRKDSYKWRIAGDKARTFLRLMLPYLRVKKNKHSLFCRCVLRLPIVLVD